jgi:H+/Cl- antiporter ClcA
MTSIGAFLGHVRAVRGRGGGGAVNQMWQIVPTLLCIVAGVIVGAVGSAVYEWRVVQELPTMNDVLRPAMLGGIMGAFIGVVWNMILLRQREARGR